VNQELQKYYEDRFSMMGSDGWKDLVEDIDTMIASLNNRQVSERAYEELNEKNV